MSMSRADSGFQSSSRTRRDAQGQSTTFGPVPSRRFGRSLGINNIPPKVCTYSCVYCQVGRTIRMRYEPTTFFGAPSVAAAVRSRVAAAGRRKEAVDRLTIVSDGEPTLDAALAGLLHQLRPLRIPVAVITNGSLLFRPDVRAALSGADHVSVKVDTVREDTWRRINRPHRSLNLSEILTGIQAFAADYKGSLTTETMLVAGVNDGEDELWCTADFIGSIRPSAAYLAVPTRPPAEPWVAPPAAGALACAHEVFRAFLPHVELLLGYEGDAFASTGDPIADLLSITAVHPMRESAVRRLMDRRHAPWSAVAALVEAGTLAAVRYGPHCYYVRMVGGRGGMPSQKEPTASPASAPHDPRSLR